MSRDRLLKNDHLLRYPTASPSRRRGEKPLLICRNALRPAHLLAGVARVAPYSSQRHPSSFGNALQAGFRKAQLASACRNLGAGRVLFEQPGKDDFFGSLLGLMRGKWGVTRSYSCFGILPLPFPSGCFVKALPIGLTNIPSFLLTAVLC
jgi:hypothetical protein